MIGTWILLNYHIRIETLIARRSSNRLFLVLSDWSHSPLLLLGLCRVPRNHFIFKSFRLIIFFADVMIHRLFIGRGNRWFAYVSFLDPVVVLDLLHDLPNLLLDTPHLVDPEILRSLQHVQVAEPVRTWKAQLIDLRRQLVGGLVVASVGAWVDFFNLSGVALLVIIQKTEDTSVIAIWTGPNVLILWLVLMTGNIFTSSALL